MHRCYIDPADWNDSEMTLTAEERHHLSDVLRAEEGDTVAVFDGKGREATARIESHGSKTVLRVLKLESNPRPAFSLTLIQALPKGKKMDLIVEKATELGVSAIHPVITERTIVRLDDNQRKERGERWQRIALNASRQCGTSWVPDVKPVSDFTAAVKECGDFDFVVVGSLQADTGQIHSVVDRVRDKKPRRVAAIIGPEGDLTLNELNEASSAGAVPVSFGSLVLRVETAALYVLSVLKYEFGRL